jgi:hypothetical protein
MLNAVFLLLLFWVELRIELLAKQALYCLSHTSSPFALVILEMGSHELFVWAGLEL